MFGIVFQPKITSNQYERQPADVIIGQPDSMTVRPCKAQDGVHNPLNLWFDSDYLWVGEFKFADRVLGYRANISAIIPEAPCSLIAIAISNHQINLSWVDNATNEQGFKLERKIGATGTYEQIKYLSANTISYSDRGLNSNIEYFYRIRAYNRYGDSDYSGVYYHPVCHSKEVLGKVRDI
ncbi:MAG: fibronectin type III domain-containing protein [bacterium]|nr:fibronectin type III domain-containing protein [bacterium]